MITDELILVSKFEEKASKCNSLKDVEELCERFLKFRKKDVPPKVTNSWDTLPPIVRPPEVEKIYVGPGAGNTQVFWRKFTIADHDLHMSQNNDVIDSAIRNASIHLVADMIDAGYVEYTHAKSQYDMNTIYQLKVGAFKL